MAVTVKPAAVNVSTCQYLQRGAFLLTFGVTILQPALVLIDHGHFQYNGIALGLSVCLPCHASSMLELHCTKYLQMAAYTCIQSMVMHDVATLM